MGGAVARVISRPKPTPAPAPVVAPTAPEVSQSSATNAMSEIDMDSTLVKKYDTRKTKARGRSSTILTSSVGVAGNNLTLGKKSLLGA